MTEFKGTKGVWFLSGTEIVSMPSQVKIVNRVSGATYEEANANAKLIAASPILLKMLQKIYNIENNAFSLKGFDVKALKTDIGTVINKAL